MEVSEELRIAGQEIERLRKRVAELKGALEEVERRLDAELDGISAVEPVVGIPDEYELLTELYNCARRALYKEDTDG